MALSFAPAFAAEPFGDDMVAPKQFTDNQATQGEAIIANTPAGPLGLRFSGGFVVDSEQPSGQFAGSDLEDAAPYLGIGVAGQMGALDLSADLGWVERTRRCKPDTCTAEVLDTDSASEPVLNFQLKLRF